MMLDVGIEAELDFPPTSADIPTIAKPIKFSVFAWNIYLGKQMSSPKHCVYILAV